MNRQRNKIPSPNYFQGQRSRARAYLMLVRRAVDFEIRYAKFRKQYSGYQIDFFEKNSVFKGVSAERISAIREIIASPSFRFDDPLAIKERLEKIIPKTLNIIENQSINY